MYCVSCKKNTGSKGSTMKTTKNGKNIKMAICTSCGSKKSQFVKGQKGGMLPSPFLNLDSKKEIEIARKNRENIKKEGLDYFKNLKNLKGYYHKMGIK